MSISPDFYKFALFYKYNSRVFVNFYSGMYGNSYVPNSYGSFEMADHLRRVRLLYELQGELEVKDSVNSKLKDQIQSLVHDNHMLKSKLSSASKSSSQS